jgi:hypothetical protein
MNRALFNRVLRPALAILLLGGLLVAQGTSNGDSSSLPVISFSVDFPASNPSHYSITVDANGHAAYESTVKADDNSDPDTYKMEFVMTEGNRARIFAWTKQANYFSGKLDSGNRKLAFTGDKELSYRDGDRSFTAHYNFSTQEPVRQLTTLFQKMAGTLDYGRQLSFDYRYQKLALDEVLKRMETQAKNDDLSEVQSLDPLLQEIVADGSVINVVRARAKELIQMNSNVASGH